ncbi:hypothetical protein MMC18_006249 [Xylographa bjoerkii]|nr:hypothetical protein [Xylographa bjoerkii]
MSASSLSEYAAVVPDSGKQLIPSSSLWDSTIDFFIGKDQQLFSLHWSLLLERAPLILSQAVKWDIHTEYQFAYLETENLLTFHAFRNWLYNDYVRGLAIQERLLEPGGPGALWSFAQHWGIDALQNICMDRITYAFFEDHGSITCSPSEVNYIYDHDLDGKMRNFCVKAFVKTLGPRRNPALILGREHPPFNATFQVRLSFAWNETYNVNDFKPYNYNHLDFHV